ncbi:M20 metallopeptidase family protein [Zobellia galactanivorans]|uniref:M20 metallopeptidase family protein n=1 Tax=Zobellia galactanivorans (strain DSM 12802 / CCUG 47099 / CIP 106680 / NCIMB 13871 / Dsij) TaxID=63186 RepID=UPI001C07012F|nr:M20 family metallopeptidase [Zobellia galactanivorans]MBU3028327.1 amidohydrolase [Zobellia galactanivorans]
MDERQKIKRLAAQYAPEFVSVRRYLHQHPELSFQEHRTCAYLKEQLLSLGVTDIVSVAETGLLATIHGGRAGKTVLLRADIDALPIQERNAVDYVSKNDGVMHACGHDAHSASLLLCAKILMELKEDFSGSVKLLFQPAEELSPGGASAVIREKAYTALGSLPHLGQHVRPDIPVGKVGFRSGKFMASMDELFLTVKGKGGHAAMPEKTIDPVLIASHIIVAAQQLVSRRADPKIPSVLSFGKVIADGAINVIPDEVVIEGTFRTLDEDWRKTALGQLDKLVTTLAEAMGGRCELKINHGYPHLKNEPVLTERLKALAEDYLGKENVLGLDQWMAAEDFAYYSQQNPSCFYMLGVGNAEKHIGSGLHTPTFDIDESALEVGGGLMVWLALSTLSA